MKRCLLHGGRVIDPSNSRDVVADISVLDDQRGHPARAGVTTSSARAWCWPRAASTGRTGACPSRWTRSTSMCWHPARNRSTHSTPRWLLGRTWGQSSDSLKVESRFPVETVEALRARGHEVEILGDFDETFGHADCLMRHADGSLEGGFDPRSDGGHQAGAIPPSMTSDLLSSPAQMVAPFAGASWRDVAHHSDGLPQLDRHVLPVAFGIRLHGEPLRRTTPAPHQRRHPGP